ASPQISKHCARNLMMDLHCRFPWAARHAIIILSSTFQLQSFVGFFSFRLPTQRVSVPFFLWLLRLFALFPGVLTRVLPSRDQTSTKIPRASYPARRPALHTVLPGQYQGFVSGKY